MFNLFVSLFGKVIFDVETNPSPVLLHTKPSIYQFISNTYPQLSIHKTNAQLMNILDLPSKFCETHNVQPNKHKNLEKLHTF